MRKLVVLQIGLAVIAFVVSAWILFSLRPKIAEKQTLQQQLSEAKQANTQLQQNPLQTSPNLQQSRAILSQGVTLFHQGNFQGAIAKYNQALKLSPNDPYGWSLNGYALFRAGQISDSVAALEKAIQFDPGDPENFLNLAKAYCSEKQYDEALNIFVTNPSPDVLAEIRGFLKSDGELKRVCSPILQRALAAEPPAKPPSNP
jgi:Flp pilus assembly protein TadD